MALGTPKATDFQKQSKPVINPVDDAWRNSGLSDDFKDRFYSAYQTYDPDTIKDTFWDKFSNFFGARSSADVLRLEAEQRRREAVNQLVNQKAEQDYNDPLNQATRERQAGVNPDLSRNVNPSTATEGTEPETPMSFSGLKTGADYAQKFAGAFTTAISICSGLQGLQAQQLQNNALKFSTAESILNMASGLPTKILSPEIIDKINSKDKYSKQIVVNAILEAQDKAQSMMQGYGIKNKKHQKQFLTGWIYGLNSLKGISQQHGDLASYFDNMDKSLKAETSWYRNGDLFNTASVRKAMQAWNNYLHNTEILSLKFQNKQSKFGIKEYEDDGYHYNDLDFKKKIIQEKKKLLNTLMQGNDTFSRILAIQLMGETDLVGNSGLGQFLKTTADIIF